MTLALIGCGGGGSSGSSPSPALVSIAVTPVNSSAAVGSTVQYTATGTYNNGTTQNLTDAVTWSSSLMATATINSTGLATPVAQGSTAITATSDAITGSTGLTVAALVALVWDQGSWDNILWR